MKLLALYSKGPKHGKSTLAKLLESDYGFVTVSFATPGRLMLSSLFDYAGGDWKAALKNKEKPDPVLNLSYREGMTTLLHEWGRLQINMSFWVYVAEMRIQYLQKMGYSRFVIDDLRYTEEEEMIRGLGGKVVRVFRPQTPVDPELMGHASEQQPVQWDLTCNNSGEPWEMLEQLNEEDLL